MRRRGGSRHTVGHALPVAVARPFRRNPLTAAAVLSFVLGAAAVISVIGAAPASAHTALVKITPYAGAQLATPPPRWSSSSTRQ